MFMYSIGKAVTSGRGALKGTSSMFGSEIEKGFE
jgi:hypothetical protein